MEKQVLVIPEDGEAEFWGDTEDMLSVDFYKKYSPGNLLAEFKGRVETRNDAEQLGAEVIGAIDDLRDKPGQDRHVLILHVPTCPDERGTKEGEEK